jgi:hypothetical protein
VVAAPEVRLRGRRLPSAPDEDDVAEDDRNRTDLLTEVWAVLHLEVQVRHQRVSRVPDGGDLLAEPHALSLADPSASLLEVPQHGVTPTANIDEDVVAIRGLLPGVADGLVRVDVGNTDDRAICRGQHGLAEAVPSLLPLPIAVVAAALLVEPHEVDGVAHDGSPVVVADERAAPAREHRPLAGQR